MYPPTLIIPAIELVTMKFATKAPINGRYVLGSLLITKDNAAEYYFPDAPYSSRSPKIKYPRGDARRVSTYFIATF